MFTCVCCYVLLCLLCTVCTAMYGRPDMTIVIDWALSNNYLSIYCCANVLSFSTTKFVVTLPLKLNRSHFLRSVQMSDCWLSFRFWSVAVIPFEDNLPCCLLLLHSSIGDASIRMTFAHVTLKNIPLPLGQLHYIFRDVS